MRWIAIAMVVGGCGGRASEGASCDAVAAKMISFVHEDGSPRVAAALARIDESAKAIFVAECADFDATQRTCIIAAKSEAGMFTCLGAPPPALTCPTDTKHVGPSPDERDDDAAGDEIRRRFSIARNERWVEYCEGNGGKHGPFHSTDGHGEETGAYDRGQKTGTWKRLDDGVLREQDEYKAGKRDGLHVEYDANGTVYVSTMFKDDVEDGPYKKVASRGSPGVEGAYQAGDKDGTWTETYANGTLKSTVRYSSGKRVGPTKELFESGDPKLVATYVDDKFDGAYVEMAESGTKIVEGTYDHGKKVGRWSTMTPDGEKIWDGTFVAGAPSGTWTFFGDKGAVATTANLTHDPSDDDVHVETNDDGAITMIDVKLAGKLSPHLEMFSTGQIKLVGGFLDGEKHGAWTEFDGHGRKVMEITWVRGKKTGTVTRWFSGTTQLQEQGTLDDSRWDGPWKHWFVTGELSDEGSYVKGTKVGKWTSYTRAGKATITEH